MVESTCEHSEKSTNIEVSRRVWKFEDQEGMEAEKANFEEAY
jgi:hypothetical protein